MELVDLGASDTYNVSMFFWYFEARNSPQTASTVIYLAGGPGQSSMVGATQSGGPCTVYADANSTGTNEWSFNNNVNMLYVDQPVGAGFSYDTILRGTQDFLFLGEDGSTGIRPLDERGGSLPQENATFSYGSFPSQSDGNTVNNTVTATRVLWHFTQTWFAHFPEYKTSNKRISFWGNSYVSWIPASAEYTLLQNEKIRNGEIVGTVLEVDTIGWSNGCADFLYQGESFPEMAYKNSYDLQVVENETYEDMKQAWPDCRDQILHCRDLGDRLDPANIGHDDDVNIACESAASSCALTMIVPYLASGLSVFDLAQVNPTPFPTSYLNGFFNRRWVQEQLGVPVNFTAMSSTVNSAFFSTGDVVRQSGMKRIEFLLEQGVKVHAMYGDRDYRCPWFGGEQLTLKANWSGAEAFRGAGYQYIHSGDCNVEDAIVGVVRQHGNMSFSRVFQAGHDVAAERPRVAFEIFNRALTEMDISSGRKPTGDAFKVYGTQGPQDSRFIRETLPPPSPVNCNVYSVSSSCTIEQYEALSNGTAEIVDFTVVTPAGGSPGSLQLTF